MGGSVAYVRNPADILNYGGIKCYPVYWVRTRGRVVAGSKYYLNKNKNKNKNDELKETASTTLISNRTLNAKEQNLNIGKVDAQA